MTTTALFVPRSTDEALKLKSEHGRQVVVMGGGTIVMGQVHDGLLFPKLAMSLARAGMDGIHRRDGWLEIGAATPVARLTDLNALPTLAQAAGQLGGPALRTLATTGGNLFAHAPYGDLAVPLLAMDAEVKIAGAKGSRTLPIDKFLNGPALKPDELLTTVRVPKPKGRGVYLKLGRRLANTPSVVAVAIQLALGRDGSCIDARIGLGAAAPQPMRAKKGERALIGKRLDEATIRAVAEAARAESNPADDALASAWYRREMVGVYVQRALVALREAA